MIAAGIIFFNDYYSLKRCITSLYDVVDIIFAIDGKFPSFPSDTVLSNDGSRELVRSFSKCLLVDCPMSEFEKRQKYLEYCELYDIDVLLITDSDEFLLDNTVIQDFRSNLQTIIFDLDKCAYNVYAIMLQSLDNPSQFTPRLRIWYNPSQMEYFSGRHYCFRNKNTRKNSISNYPNFTVIKDIKIGHDHSYRSKFHLESRSIYQKWLVNFERSLPQ
jgi:hypothetical protein